MEGISYPHAVEIVVNKGILPNGNELALNRWADYYSWCISLSWDGGVMMEGGDDYKCLAASLHFFLLLHIGRKCLALLLACRRSHCGFRRTQSVC